MPLDPNIPHQNITYRIIGAAMRVHNRVKPGLRERHYQHDLTAEIREAGLKVSEEHHIEVYDGDRWLGRLYLDHLVEDCVVVEVKAFSHILTNEEVAQVICYLAATGLKGRVAAQLWTEAPGIPTHPAAQEGCWLARAYPALPVEAEGLTGVRWIAFQRIGSG